MHSESPRDAQAQPESEIRSKKSADFAWVDLPEDRMHEVSSEAPTVPLAEQAETEALPESLTLDTVRDEVNGIAIELRNPDLSPAQRDRLERRSQKLLSHAETLLMQQAGAEKDADLSRRVDDLENIVGAADAEHAPGSPSATDLPPATAAAERQGERMSEYLQAGKRDDLEGFAVRDATVQADSDRIDGIVQRGKELEGEIRELKNMAEAAKDDVKRAAGAYKEVLGRADALKKELTDEPFDTLRYFAREKPPLVGILGFRKPDARFAPMRAKLLESLQALVDTVNGKRRDGYRVPEPNPGDLVIAGIEPVEPNPEESDTDKQLEENRAELDRLTAEEKRMRGKFKL